MVPFPHGMIREVAVLDEEPSPIDLDAGQGLECQSWAVQPLA